MLALIQNNRFIELTNRPASSVRDDGETAAEL